MKKKLLIFHPYLAPYRIDLYNKLSETFQTRALLTASNLVKKKIGFNLDYVNKLATFDYSYTNNGFYLGNHLISFDYIKSIWSFKPNIVLAHELGVNTLIVILMKFIFQYKIFVTIDDSPSMLQNYSKFRQWLQRFVVKRSDVILVVHPSIEKYLVEKYEKYKCQILYFPIIQDEHKLEQKFNNASNKAMELSEEHELESKKVILFVGRLKPAKSPEVLLNAFIKIKQRNDILIFVGDGVSKIELETYVEERGLGTSILFMGKLSGEELYAWYRLADIFVLPSKFEPFGAVVNEALVAGCNVIISNKVGSNSLVTKENGLIFNYEEEQALGKNLESMLSEVDINNRNKTNRKNKMPILFDNQIKDFYKFCDI